MSVHIPSSVLAAGWIPFVIVICLVVLFSAIYVRYFNSRTDSEWSTTLSAVFALSVTLLTTALIPVDVFLVSFMKNSDGTFKEWASTNASRTSVEDSVLIGYYTLYGLITFCLFLLLPFMYFFYEEREDDATCKSRCCAALKYTVVFLIIVFVLLLVGALVHTKPIPKNSNSTDWEKMAALFNMESNWAENSLSLVISILSLIGMTSLLTYTAYGMAALPVGLIKGYRNLKSERLDIQDRQAATRDRIAAIRKKYSTGKTMSRRDARQVDNLEESEALMDREDRHLAVRDTFCQRCCVIFRPFKIIIGIVLVLVAILVFLSLLLTNIDKTMHSLGPKYGYALPTTSLPNPVDISLVFCQKVFPLDYILFAVLIFYLVFCSMSGVQNIGIWFFWLRMYRIRPRRTRPQAMLMLCMILMFVMLAVNIVIYELTPQYSSYGSQHYQVHTKENKTETKVCTTAQTDADCVMTGMNVLLTRFFYKMWFFGAAYYWITWAFLLVILLAFLIAICRKAKSSIDGEVDADDIVDSDEELLSP